jgi:hypothetical protein
MKTPFKRKSAISTDIAAELARLNQRLAETEKQASKATAELAAAHAARRDVLSEDASVVDQASAKVRKAQLEADDLTKLVDEYRSAIAEAQDRLSKAQSAERVEAAASQLEAIADQMDQQAPALEKAAAAVAASVRSMLAIMPADMAVFPTFNMHRPGDRAEGRAPYASAREAASAIIAEALLNAVPEIFDRYYSSGSQKVGGEPDGYRAGLSRIMDPTAPQPGYSGDTADFVGLTPARAIAAFVSNRARENASKIRGGEIEPDISSLRPTREAQGLRLVSEEYIEVVRALG